MSIIGFTAEAFDSGVLLRWNAGAGASGSSASDIAEITIQYAILGETGVGNVTPNTPPYVVRELQQPQLSDNVLYHPNLQNGREYSYTIFVHYMDTGIWQGPTVSNSVTPIANAASPFTRGSLSFTKLGTNTILASIKDSRTEVVVWLPDNQSQRRASIENTIDLLKPSHVRTVVAYEPYYVAQTTTAQFLSGSYSSGSYDIQEGYIKNKVATIDSSFSGQRAIFGG